MPSGVFKPYAGVSTAILIFTKTNAGGTEKVWFYDMKADGLSLDDKRQPVKENDIPEIIARYHQRKLTSEIERSRTEQSFVVSKTEIAENDYDLSINRYKEVSGDEVVMAMKETAENAVPMPNLPEMDVMWTVASGLLTDVNMAGNDVAESAEKAQKEALQLIESMK
jgi:type I restriction-modification system DNA methylase subunit